MQEWDPHDETREEMRERFIRLVDFHKTMCCACPVDFKSTHDQRRCPYYHNIRDYRKNIWENWTEPSAKSCFNKTANSYHPSVFKTIECHHEHDCPFKEFCGFHHLGEVKLDRKHGMYSRSQWIASLDGKFEEHFRVNTSNENSAHLLVLGGQSGASHNAAMSLPPMPPMPPMPPAPTTITRHHMSLSSYFLNALKKYPKLLERVNSELYHSVTCSIANISLGDGTTKEGLMLIGEASEVHFKLGCSIIEHVLSNLGEEYEINTKFNFSDKRTRDNITATLKAFGQNTFSDVDGHTSLTITDDGKMRMRILKGTPAYTKRVSDVINSVLNCHRI